MALLIRYWKPLAVFLLLLMTWLHGHHSGVSGERNKWELVVAKQATVAAKNAAAAEAKARKQEADWAAAFDAAATIQNQELSDVQAHRDRLLSQLRSVRVPVQPAGTTHLPEAPANSGKPQDATAGGQPGLAGEELVSRFAVCDEVVTERNQCVGLLEAERR